MQNKYCTAFTLANVKCQKVKLGTQLLLLLLRVMTYGKSYCDDSL